MTRTNYLHEELILRKFLKFDLRKNAMWEIRIRIKQIQPNI
jgi:hypothetical protein